MTKIVFVHGGGVRKATFSLTFKFLEQRFLDQGIPHTLVPCFWGDEQGSRPPVLCIPNVNQSANGRKTLTLAQRVDQWELLYRDPCTEMRLLQARPNMQARTPQPHGLQFWTHLESYRPSPRLRDFLSKWQMTSYWDGAWGSIRDNEMAKEILLLSGQDLSEAAAAIARGLVAKLTTLALADNLLVLDGDHRDELVKLLLTDWFGRDGSVNGHVGRLLGDVRTSSEPDRARPFDATSAALGDVLLYQARGSAIRESIRRAIGKAIDSSGDADQPCRVVLLAHSLGGIACVDLLAMEALPQVTHLITVGSQSPYLYEIGALQGLDLAKEETLPATFPPWLNLYDPNDFLSYVAEPVFQDPNIRDVRIESGQPFPESHGAYWTNDATWQAIKGFVA